MVVSPYNAQPLNTPVESALLKTTELRRANAVTDSSANDHLIMYNIRLSLGAASLQWVEGEKELSMRTTFATCMESPGLSVAKDN